MKTKFALLLLYIGCSLNLSAQSNFLWAKSSTETSINATAEGFSVSANASGDVAETGFYGSTTISFGSNTLTNTDNTGNSSDVFVVKYDASGNLLWTRNAGGAYVDYAYGVSIDSNGNVFVTVMSYSSTITFGSFTLTNSAYPGIFIAKYDPLGNVLWVKNPAGEGVSNSICCDASGNVLVTGGFSSATIVFGSTTLTNANPGFQDIFVAKYDPLGNELWAKRAGGVSEDVGVGVSSDLTGNVLLTGDFQSPTINFGTTTLTNTGGSNYYISKFDSSGNALWASSTSGYALGKDVCADMSGNIFATGTFGDSTITFGSTTLTNSNPSFADIFVVKYNGNGSVLWAQSGAGPINEKSYSVCCDGSGNLFVTGFFRSTISFGSVSLHSLFSQDPMFIIKYDPSGNVICASALESGGDDQNDITVDALGNAYIGGDFAIDSFIVGMDTLHLTGMEDVFIAKFDHTCFVQEAVTELEGKDILSIYPNPSEGKFSLNSKTKNGEILVYNSLGEIVFQSRINSSISTIDLSNQASGIYFVNVKTEKESFTQKIIIQ